MSIAIVFGVYDDAATCTCRHVCPIDGNDQRPVRGRINLSHNCGGTYSGDRHRLDRVATNTLVLEMHDHKNDAVCRGRTKVLTREGHWAAAIEWGFLLGGLKKADGGCGFGLLRREEKNRKWCKHHAHEREDLKK